MFKYTTIYALIFFCTLQTNSLNASDRQEHPHEIEKHLLFSIQITNKIDLDNIGEGGFDQRISFKRQSKYFTSKIRDCSRKIESIATHWILSKGLGTRKSVLNEGEKYLVHYGGAGKGYYELLYRIFAKEEYAILSVSYHDIAGKMHSVVLSKEEEKFRELLTDAIRCEGN